ASSRIPEAAAASSSKGDSGAARAWPPDGAGGNRTPRVARTRGACRYSVNPLSGHSTGRFGPRHHRAAEPLAERAQVRQLRPRQLLVALRQVVHGVVEPSLPMLFRCFQNTAAQDVAEQLITRLLERGRNVGFPRLFGFAQFRPPEVRQI